MHTKKRRDELVAEILHTVEMPRIIAAAGFMLRQRLGVDDATEITPTVAEIAEFVATLNTRDLKVLRKVALSLEGSIVPLH